MKKQSKLLSLLMALALLLTFLPVSALADSGYTVTLSASAESVTAGGSLDVTLSVSNSDQEVTTLSAVYATVTYDTAYFTYDADNSGVTGYTVTDDSAIPGTLTISRVGDAFGTGDLLTLRFTAGSSAGSGSFTLASAKAAAAAIPAADAPVANLGSAVSVAVTGSTTPATHTVTLPSALDAIWSMTATSAGGTDATVGTPGTASDGQTVTVTVKRGENALTASIGGITVMDGSGQPVEVTTVSSTPGDDGTVKEAVYSFVMPGSDVTVTLKESYAGITIFEQKYPTAVIVEKKTFTRAQMTAMDEADDFYYGGYDSTPAVVEGRGTVSVALTDMLENAGVEFLPGDSITITSIDGSETTLTYSELYGVGRYYFTALYTGYDWPSRSNGKIVCQPHLIITGALKQSSSFGEGESIATAACDSTYAYKLAFGLTMDEFSVNADASPTAECLTATGLCQLHHRDYRKPCV